VAMSLSLARTAYVGGCAAETSCKLMTFALPRPTGITQSPLRRLCAADMLSNRSHRFRVDKPESGRFR
jgi:hypothetical protein